MPPIYTSWLETIARLIAGNKKNSVVAQTLAIDGGQYTTLQTDKHIALIAALCSCQASIAPRNKWGKKQNNPVHDVLVTKKLVYVLAVDARL